MIVFVFFFSSRRRHTRYWRDWSSDVCSSDLVWERVREKGFAFDVTGIRAPDADGTVLFEVPDAKSEIGRASCRGKSVDLGGRRIIKKKNKDNSSAIYVLQDISIR